MKKSALVFAFTISGIVVLFALQSVWLYNTYWLIKNDITIECSGVLERALDIESDIIAKKLPEGTEIIGGPQSDSIPMVTYLYDGISKLGRKFSLHRMDSITQNLLKKNNIDTDFDIRIINPKTKEVYETSKKRFNASFVTIKSKTIPIRLDWSQGVEFILNNPQGVIFERMWLLLASTAIMVVFIIGCIVYQIRIISRMKKIFQVREDFSYALIHDMKTPLTTISMALDLLSKGRLDANPEMKARYCKIAEAEIDRLLNLTNKVLTLSKLENHKLDITKSVLELRPMLNKLTEKFADSASKPVHFNINLKVEETYADGGYLEEVISNLIDNSIKYSGDAVDIEISSEKNEQYTIIKVYDNGFGISEKYLRSIFEKYERGAASGRNRKGGAAGFGLGLNFAYRVVEAHGGKLLVSSIEGQFSEFCIYLPEILEEI